MQTPVYDLINEALALRAIARGKQAAAAEIATSLPPGHRRAVAINATLPHFERIIADIDGIISLLRAQQST